MADTTTPDPAKPAKPATSIYWRLYARVRVHARIKVQIYIGEPLSDKWYQGATEVQTQTLTLTRLGRMLRKLCK